MNPLQSVVEIVGLLAGAALILVAPGYAIVQACFGPGTLPRAERATLMIGISIGACVVGGLLLQYLPWGLGAATWLAFVAAVVGAAAVFARGRLAAPLAALAGELRRIPAVQLVCLAGAALVALSAVSLAVSGARQQEQRAAFTQLWIQPAGAGALGAVTVGVRSDEAVPVRYTLRLLADGAAVQPDLPIALAAGESWSSTIPIAGPAPERVEAQLYRADQPGAIYRRVFVQR